ncbi:benzoate 4-monooxygenase cytochrome p450 [Moniliophthora roreri MCA 2997]|uniref:Benzoate 4-monooxygenase cytochrome p450 n=1 Tax=Moniliophthora roreri (strain MCA 2997) TaxID=1381753 RepID=V2XQJ9_MONRO|nr:benzoate 4-monooxygenase cytochrome p450 [Moniliophthora roreri MCA 2997]
MTRTYRVYYTVFGEEGWVNHLEKLHDRYGPVVRVTPWELHFNSSDAYDDIHVLPKPHFPKDPGFYQSYLIPDAVVSLCDPQKASKRRALLGTYFSRRAVLQLEHVVQSTVDALIEKLSAYAETREPADMFLAYRATSFDIITSYLFGQRFNALGSPGFRNPLLVGLDDSLRATWLGKYLPIEVDKWLPESLLRKISPAMNPFFDQVGFITGKLDEIAHDPPSLNDVGHKAIFSVLLDTSKASGVGDPWIFPRQQIIDECVSLQFAGSDTVGNACMVGTFGLATNREALEKLRRELDGVWPDSATVMSFEVLEKLPYLGAVIKESLRMSHGIATPLPRVVGPSGATIAGVPVPAGTVASCGSYFVHNDPTVFPEPKQFKPERWLDENSREVEKYLVAFSKGPRICLGINLAWCELYLIFANVFRKLDLEIWNTTVDDLKFQDFFLPMYTGNHLKARVGHRTTE